ncbi:MAG: PEP-CTERM sorting domain-containing protein, partial [Roseibacillus sp.]|nr:PEP-CTERM sorting domain-containing protein [Roseibacillus sp.]
QSGGITLNYPGGSATSSINDGDGAGAVAWFSFAIVPEPSSMSLLALAGLTLLRRRRS